MASPSTECFTYEAGTGRLSSLNIYTVCYTYNLLNQRDTASVTMRTTSGSSVVRNYKYDYDEFGHLYKVCTTTSTGSPVSNRERTANPTFFPHRRGVMIARHGQSD